MKFKNSGFPVLYVDDDPISHKFVKAYLPEWEIRFASSAKEALQILEKENIQVVITDIQMPEMSGIDLLREIKRIHGTIQVIVVTSTTDIDNLINALSGGANDFLPKPLTKSDLEESLTNTFDKINRWKKAMRELFRKNRTD